MTPGSLRWAIVLGAGDGKRLESLTRHQGVPVPKQYCTLDGGPSLFELALDRSERVVPPESIVTVVAERHRQWWTRDLSRLCSGNVIVQPENRGTAAGVLLPLLDVHRRDPNGLVMLLPSDHWVEREWVLADAIGSAFELLEHDSRRILLLGISPDQPESGYGWIVPGPERTVAGRVSLHGVDTFVEKPTIDTALQLMDRGGLWNSFLIVASVSALLDLYAQRLPGLLCSMTMTVEPTSPVSLADLYASLEPGDFSRDLLQGAEAELGVVRVPACGWTDLGTPRRVAECMRRRTQRAACPVEMGRIADRVSLASALSRLD